jgi:hypothetical protein
VALAAELLVVQVVAARLGLLAQMLVALEPVDKVVEEVDRAVVQVKPGQEVLAGNRLEAVAAVAQHLMEITQA